MSTPVTAKIRDAWATPKRITVVLTEDVAWQDRWELHRRVTFPFPGYETLGNEWRTTYDRETATLRLSIDEGANIKPLQTGRWARVEVGQYLVGPRSDNEPLEPDDVYYVRVDDNEPPATALPSRAGTDDSQRPTDGAGDKTRTSGRVTRTAMDPATRAALWVVLGGFSVLLVLGIVALIVMAVSDTTLSTVASVTTGAFGVIGSIAGAFFGIHAGQARLSASGDRAAVEAEKVQMLATMVGENGPDAREMIRQLRPSAGGER